MGVACPVLKVGRLSEERLFVCAGFGVESELRKRRAYGSLGYANPQSITGDVVTPNEAVVPDAGAFSEFDPGAIFPLIESKAFDPLPKRQVFAQADHIECNRTRKFQDQLRGNHAVVG